MSMAQADRIGTWLALSQERLMGAIFTVMRFFPSVKQHGHTVEILKSVQDLTCHSTGCQGCWLSEGGVLDNHIRYAELWESEESLHRHIRSDLYRRLLAAM